MPTARSSDRSARECHWRVYFPPSDQEFRFWLGVGESVDGETKNVSGVDGGVVTFNGKETGQDATVRCYWDRKKISFFVDSEMMKSSANCSLESDDFEFMRSSHSMQAPELIQYYEGQLIGDLVCESEQNGLRLFQIAGGGSEQGKANVLELRIDRQ